ncbi:MAG TPA: DoxX family protein [Verrucomicrobiae bacterium]|nr:DoxX family protein [Verrucomicrobiae bacterium]
MNTQLESVSKVRPWLGAIITGLVVLFLAFDGVTKILQLTPVVKASEKLGIAADLLLGIGVLLLTCTVIYLIPKTTILGAILLTGYLGGATAIHVSARSGAFPVAFSIVFGVLVWVGLVLREPRLLSLILLRH